MTRPMTPGQEPGESEFCFGPGMIPHPDLDFQTGKIPAPSGEGSRDQWNQRVAELRTDTTDPASVADVFDMGNPDRFGPEPPLVRESASKPASGVDVSRPGGIPGAPFKTGVTREP